MNTSPISEQRFAARIAVNPGSCWLWTGSRNKRGYGYFNDGVCRRRYAHRYAYERIHGRLTSRLQFVCHTCDNPPCVNPEHLFLSTPKGNRDDMVAKGRSPQQLRTNCKNGHPYSPENVRVRRHRDGYDYRTCKICARASFRAHYARRKEAA
jgi:hypothetical protein